MGITNDSVLEVPGDQFDVSDKQYEQKPMVWDIELLRRLEWKRFEELSEALLRVIGLHASCTSLGEDDGVDIEIYSKTNPVLVAAIVQCKAWSKPVDVQHVRAFYDVMAAKKVDKGYFITTSSFSDEAAAFGNTGGISLISGKKMLQLMSALSPEKSDKLLRLATEGDDTT